MKKYLVITADTNDGDYITALNEITSEQLFLIQHIIDAIKAFKPYGDKWKHTTNYSNGDFVRKDLGEKTAEELYGQIPGFELFQEFIPVLDNNGIHTITNITVLEIFNETKLL